MRTSDLMDGDIFMQNDKPCRFEISARGAYFVRLCDRSMYLPCAGIDMKPIPLTEDILKANGFRLSNNGNCIYPFDTAEYYLECRVWEDGVVVNIESSIAKPHTGVNRVHLIIHYVHELLHALRLCGLTELIYNFKIQQ